MNKLFIVFLAVCLISVNSALVKRETATSPPNYLEDISKQIQQLTDSAKNTLTEAFDPEKIKKSFNEGVDNINKWYNENIPKKEAEAKQ